MKFSCKCRRSLYALSMLAMFLSGCSPFEGKSPWEYAEIKDKISDKVSFHLHNKSKDQKFVIMLNCDVERPTVFGYILSGKSRALDEVKSEFRAGSKSANSKDLLVSDKMMWVQGEPISNLLVYIGDERELVARFRFKDGNVDAEFDVTGTQAAYANLKKKCQP